MNYAKFIEITPRLRPDQRPQRRILRKREALLFGCCALTVFALQLHLARSVRTQHRTILVFVAASASDGGYSHGTKRLLLRLLWNSHMSVRWQTDRISCPHLRSRPAPAQPSRSSPPSEVGYTRRADACDGHVTVDKDVQLRWLIAQPVCVMHSKA